MNSTKLIPIMISALSILGMQGCTDNSKDELKLKQELSGSCEAGFNGRCVSPVTHLIAEKVKENADGTYTLGEKSYNDVDEVLDVIDSISNEISDKIQKEYSLTDAELFNTPETNIQINDNLTYTFKK